MRTTHTLNPLHFEDLEPHRFEDMVRQLAYDLRPWQELEALGRSGSDGGVDIRGVERVLLRASAFDEGEELDSPSPADYEDRTWVIQCKRERSIPPSKVRQVVNESLRTFEMPPYGFILAASANFSAKARETFRMEMRKRGIQEFILWGKAELEDRLFEPRNDHLLFAYFGISLQVRRRSRLTFLRARLATKRQLVKHLGSIKESTRQEVLIRDVDSTDYPCPEDPEAFQIEPRWRYFRFRGHLRVNYLAFVVRKYWAWIKPDRKEWDALEDFDQGYFQSPRLFGGPEQPPRDEKEEQARRFWLTQVPKVERALLRTIGFIHYDRVVLVDELGDHFHSPPHLLVDCEKPDRLFDDVTKIIEPDSSYDRRIWKTDTLEHASLFPSELPQTSVEELEAALAVNGQ